MKKSLLNSKYPVIHGPLSIRVFSFFIALFFIAMLPCNKVAAQADSVNQEEERQMLFDEIPVTFFLESWGGFNMDVIYTANNLLYINTEELFKQLKINCEVSATGDSISGFTENENKPYLIDNRLKRITGFKTINSRQGIIKRMGIVYMESSLFKEVFGISISFNFRSLSCMIKSDFELPVIKELRLQKMHKNLSKIKGEIKPDTVVGRKYHLFKLGTADYSIATTQAWKQYNNNRINLALGTELLFGEADISVNLSNQATLNNRQVQYLWRWIDNDKKYIKQAQAGMISVPTASFINVPVVGAVIRNTPTTVRKASGFYTINESTEPNWTVELYINNELTDYTTADASGLFSFKVPIVYGYTTLKLKYYGPMGEERTEERTLNTAFTLMPAKELEYGLGGGFLLDSLHSRMAKAEFNYGLNRFLTMGGGMEYLSSIPGNPSIPFVKMAFQPISKLVLNFEYAHTVKAQAFANYYFKRNAFAEVNYTKFKEGQLATPFNALQELKAKFSVPIKYKMLGANATFDYSRMKYKGYSFNRMSLILSGYYKQYSISSTTELNQSIQKALINTFTRSILAFNIRLQKGITLRPAVTFNLTARNIMLYSTDVEKRIKNGVLSLSFQNNIMLKAYIAGVNVRYDLQSVRSNFSSFVSKKTTTTTQSVQGSLAFGSGNKHVHASGLPAVGKGGIAIYPFLDLNQNGIFDKGEKILKLNSVKVMSNNVTFSNKDSIIRITGLYAFTNYILEFNDRDLENISWRFKDHIYKVLIDPNQFKRLDIPVIAMGEVSGMIFTNTNNALRGTGRLFVKFYDNSGRFVAETLSESDGYFQYLGLKPGEYTARLDAAQLEKAGLATGITELKFTIKQNEQGDIITLQHFILNKVEKMAIPPTEAIKE